MDEPTPEDDVTATLDTPTTDQATSRAADQTAGLGLRAGAWVYVSTPTGDLRHRGYTDPEQARGAARRLAAHPDIHAASVVPFDETQLIERYVRRTDTDDTTRVAAMAAAREYLATLTDYREQLAASPQHVWDARDLRAKIEIIERELLRLLPYLI
jgi:hypothetical protein